MMDRRYKKKMDRHWNVQLARAKAVVDELDFSSWFDFWHTHVDWDCKGNRYPESRAAVAKATYELLRYAEAAAVARDEPIQIFAQICRETGSNAVYIHSGNPNGSSFPCKFEDTNWSPSTPPELEGVIDRDLHELGVSHFGEEETYVIRAKA